MKTYHSCYVTILALIILNCSANSQVNPTKNDEAQKISPEIHLDQGLSISGFSFPTDKKLSLSNSKALFSVVVDGEIINSSDVQNVIENNAVYSFLFTDDLEGSLTILRDFKTGWKAQISLVNNSNDTLTVENFVPFGELDEHIYITSSGPWNLARSKLFRPGSGPVGIILPDNSWELGYASVELTDGTSICALARRTEWENASRRRYKTDLYTQGKITWTIRMERFEGE